MTAGHQVSTGSQIRGYLLRRAILRPRVSFLRRWFDLAGLLSNIACCLPKITRVVLKAIVQYHPNLIQLVTIRRTFQAIITDYYITVAITWKVYGNFLFSLYISSVGAVVSNVSLKLIRNCIAKMLPQLWGVVEYGQAIVEVKAEHLKKPTKPARTGGNGSY